MLLYHVTNDLNHRGLFTPRVPENVEDYDEDDTVPRICFSTSLEGALSAVPWGALNLRDELEFMDNRIKVYVVDTRILNPIKLVTTEQLVRQGLVRDAWGTSEVWYLEKINLYGASIIIEIIDFSVVTINPPDHISSLMKERLSSVDLVCNLTYKVVC